MQNFKDTFYKNIWPILTGFFTASITMMICEFTNSFLFPFPENFDNKNQQMIIEFTNSHSPNIFILVALGWILGGIFGGIILTKISQKYNFNLSKKYFIFNKIELQIFALSILLSFSAFMNLLILNTAYTFHILGIISFFITTYLGYKFANK
jgi:hypothetical protein